MVPLTAWTRYGEDEFLGIIIDTGAATYSTAGEAQFKALQRVRPDVTLDKTTHDSIKVRFGVGNSASIGSTRIQTTIGEVVFHVMPATTPFLLSLRDMDRLDAKFDNLENFMAVNGIHVPVLRRYGHAFITIAELPRVGDMGFFTKSELRRLHRRFGHPSVERLHRLFRSAGHDDVKFGELVNGLEV